MSTSSSPINVTWTVGSSPDCEVRVDQPFVSGKHCRLSLHGNQYMLEDLGSTNGTYLNEELLDGPRPLHPGDRVRIGDSEFVFEVD